MRLYGAYFGNGNHNVAFGRFFFTAVYHKERVGIIDRQPLFEIAYADPF